MFGKELNELRKKLKEVEEKRIKEIENRGIENNKKYIGKCYFDKKEQKYIRVLSAKSSNTFRLECMCFSFPVKFVEQLSNYYYNIFSVINFCGIYVEDYPMFCNDNESINSLEEISEEEYFNKMNEYIKELQNKIKNGYFDTSKNK